MTDPRNTDETEPAPPFSQWLFAQRNGATHAELTDALAEVARSVMETGRTGSVTLKIQIGKATKKGGHQMVVSDDVIVKAPRPERDESIFFFDESNGALTRTDPQQPQLPLQEVPKPTAQLKEA